MTFDYQRAWAVPCPTCHAPIGAPCADLRSYDRDFFGIRTHRERAELRRTMERRAHCDR